MEFDKRASKTDPNLEGENCGEGGISAKGPSAQHEGAFAGDIRRLHQNPARLEIGGIASGDAAKRGWIWCVCLYWSFVDRIA